MYIILHNPLSKNKKSKKATKKIVDVLKKKHVSFRLKSLLKVEDIAGYLEKNPATHIILVGGDGTVNAFINRSFRLSSQTPVFLRGSGSGNDFLRTLKKVHPHKQAIYKITFDDLSHYFINGSGMGIDGEIAHLVNQSIKKKRRNYLTNTLKSFLNFKPTTLDVIIDDTPYSFKKAYLININSGQFIGGGMRITPNASPADDLLDIIVVHRIPKLMLFVIFFSIYLGLHKLFKRYVFHQKGRAVRATFKTPQTAQCDGETFESIKTITVSHTNKYAYFKPFSIKNT